MTKREVSLLAEAHDSSTGLNTSIHTVHYTNLGFPIPNQGPVLGVSPSSCAISVFVCGGGSFYFAESQLPHIPTLNRHTHSQIKKIIASDARAHRTWQNKAPKEGASRLGVGGSREPLVFRHSSCSLGPVWGRQEVAALSFRTGSSTSFQVELQGQPER